MTHEEAREALRKQYDGLGSDHSACLNCKAFPDCVGDTCHLKEALIMADKALKVADEVEEASKRIGSRYYGPDTCNKCAHRNDLMSKGREEPSIFCEHWGLKVNSFDHCSNFEEVKHD